VESCPEEEGGVSCETSTNLHDVAFEKYVLLITKAISVTMLTSLVTICTTVCTCNNSTFYHSVCNIIDINIYTGCPRRNGQNFGRVFLMLNYTDITQNTYIQS